MAGIISFDDLIPQGAAPPQSAPTPAAAPTANQSADPAAVQGMIDQYQKYAAMYLAAGDKTSAALFNRAALELQAQADKGQVWTPQGYQTAPGWDQNLAATERATTNASEGVKDRYKRDFADYESGIRTRENESKHALDMTEKDRDFTRAMNQSWISSKPYNDMRIASQFRGSAADALERVKKDGSGAASTQLIISYVKSYDPTSVVNDGERDIRGGSANLNSGLSGMSA